MRLCNAKFLPITGDCVCLFGCSSLGEVIALTNGMTTTMTRLGEVAKFVSRLSLLHVSDSSLLDKKKPLS